MEFKDNNGWTWRVLDEQEKTVRLVRVHEGGMYETYFHVDYGDDVVIPKTIKVLGQDFTVTEIGTGAFWWSDDCESEGGEERSLVIPDSVTLIDTLAFSGNENLHSVKLPAHLTDIRNGVFDGCISLKELTLPDALECLAPIFGETRYGGALRSLRKLTLGKKLCRFEDKPCDKDGGNCYEDLTFFGGGQLPALQELHCRMPQPFDLDMTGAPFDTCTLFVPRGTLAAYEAAPGWNQFHKIEEEDVD